MLKYYYNKKRMVNLYTSKFRVNREQSQVLSTKLAIYLYVSNIYIMLYQINQQMTLITENKQTYNS